MGGGSTDMILVDDGVKSLEVVELVNTQPVRATGMNLLANEEFDKESGGYKSESEDDDSLPEKEEENVESSPEPERVSKKRKAYGELHSSKKKKNKSAIVPERVGNEKSKLLKGKKSLMRETLNAEYDILQNSL